MNSNDFGLAHVWMQGDFVTRFVAVLLLAMSVASWMVILMKALDLRRFMGQARRIESFWHAADFADGLSKLGPDASNPFRALALEGREAAAHHNAQEQLHDTLGASEWLTRALRNSIDDSTARMQSGLAVLASVVVARTLATPIDKLARAARKRHPFSLTLGGGGAFPGVARAKSQTNQGIEQSVATYADGVYRGKPTTCVSCHQQDYTTATPNHAAAMFPNTCASCHTTTRWDGATFDHDGPSLRALENLDGDEEVVAMRIVAR